MAELWWGILNASCFLSCFLSPAALATMGSLVMSFWSLNFSPMAGSDTPITPTTRRTAWSGRKVRLLKKKRIRNWEPYEGRTRIQLGVGEGLGIGIGRRGFRSMEVVPRWLISPGLFYWWNSHCESADHGGDQENCLWIRGFEVRFFTLFFLHFSRMEFYLSHFHCSCVVRMTSCGLSLIVLAGRSWRLSLETSTSRSRFGRLPFVAAHFRFNISFSFFGLDLEGWIAAWGSGEQGSPGPSYLLLPGSGPQVSHLLRNQPALQGSFINHLFFLFATVILTLFSNISFS